MDNSLITHVEPKSPISECFRALRTNLQFKNSNKEVKTILVTSTIQSEGKSTVTANLAITFAQAGKKTIIVDADLRRTRQHKIFGISQIPGLSNYLLGLDGDGNACDEHISAYIKETEVENLDVLPAGTIPPNPSELLATSATVNMIEKLKLVYDIIIFDGTPSALVTDAIILSRIVDTTIILAAHKETKMDDLMKIKKDIENVGGNIAGVILNKYPISKNKYNDTYYYGSSSENTFKGAINISSIATEKKEVKEVEEVKKVKETEVEVELTVEKKENISDEIAVSVDTVSIVDEEFKAELDKKIGKMEYIIEKLENKMKEMKEEKQEAITKEVEEKMLELSNKMEELSREKAEGEDVNQEVYSKINELKEKIEALEIEREIEKAKGGIVQEQNNKLEELYKKLEKLETEKEVDNVLEKETQNKVDEIFTKIETLDSKIQKLDEEGTQTSEAVKEMQKSDSEESENEMATKVSSLEEQLEYVQNKLDCIGAINDKEETLEKEVENKVEALSSKIEELESKLDSIEIVEETEKITGQEVEDKVGEMSAKIEEMENKIRELEEARLEELKEQAKVVDMRDFVEHRNSSEQSDPIWYTKPEKNVKLYEIEIAVGEDGEQMIREINDSMVISERKL